ncbi:MAG: YybH family protein [Caulobacteraceae bacterium]
MTMLRAAAACGLALTLAAPALGQNLSLRAPPWATPLIISDITPTNGGRAAISAPGIDMAVRVTIAPSRSGGVARVIRYDLRGEQGTLAVHRLTKPNGAWLLWGADTPRLTNVTAAQRTEIATLTRAVMGAAGGVGGAEEVCEGGSQAYFEVAFEGRSTSFSRPCLANTDAVGRLGLRLSDLAGSRNEEELAAAAVAELLEADRAFAAKAAADGVPAAFNEYADADALIVTGESVATGRAGIAARYQNWPQGARLEWAPETARVSQRGDMGWTWGNSTYIAPDGTRTPGRYVSVWTRGGDGNWRFAFDAPIR